MNNKALTATELEVTQKIQTHFPRGLSTEILGCANSCPVPDLTQAVRTMLERLASGAKTAAKKLLEFITSISVPGSEHFVAEEYFNGFEANTADEVKVKISYIGENFKSRFKSKVEENVVATDIKIHRILIDSKDPEIITELGDVHETTLTYFWQALGLQGHGQKGKLLANGCANVFYIRDGIDETLWAVSARWGGDGWYLDAGSVESPGPWGAGGQVCSR